MQGRTQEEILYAKRKGNNDVSLPVMTTLRPVCFVVAWMDCKLSLKSTIIYCSRIHEYCLVVTSREQHDGGLGLGRGGLHKATTGTWPQPNVSRQGTAGRLSRKVGSPLLREVLSLARRAIGMWVRVRVRVTPF